MMPLPLVLVLAGVLADGLVVVTTMMGLGLTMRVPKGGGSPRGLELTLEPPELLPHPLQGCAVLTTHLDPVLTRILVSKTPSIFERFTEPTVVVRTATLIQTLSNELATLLHQEPEISTLLTMVSTACIRSFCFPYDTTPVPLLFHH